MKRYGLLLGLITLFLYSCNEQKPLSGNSSTDQPLQNQEQEKETKARVDSVIEKTKYGMVYITRDTTNEMYDWMDMTVDESFLRRTFDKQFMNDLENELDIQVKPVEGINIYPYWTKLNKFKSRYYVYSPSDWMYHATMYVTDSAVYRLASPDPTISLVTSFQEKSPGSYQIGTENRSGLVKTVEIECIDFEKGIYLWKFIKEDENVLHEEYKTPSNMVRNFEMIVNDCYDQKCFGEFQFD